MTTSNTPDRSELIRTGVEDFQHALHEALAESLAANVETVTALAQASTLITRMTAQQTILQTVLAERQALLDLRTADDPAMLCLINAQVQEFDAHVLKICAKVGVKKEVAAAALDRYDAIPAKSKPVNRINGKATTVLDN